MFRVLLERLRQGHRTSRYPLELPVLPDRDGDVPVYRVWVDFTYAASFWEAAALIAEELGGRVVGAACVYPELAAGMP